jgi:hypothetical protein
MCETYIGKPFGTRVVPSTYSTVRLDSLHLICPSFEDSRPAQALANIYVYLFTVPI